MPKTRTTRELEREISPEGLKLAKKSLRLIRAFANNSAEVSQSPETEDIHKLVAAYIEEGK
jgi:hypothetical protein